MRKNHNFYLHLAFNIAQQNLGKTKSNPSVGCVVVKNGTVISSGVTSINGRPHAEFNALNKKKNFKNSDLYVTLEPCTHFGKTPPCSNIIKKKGVKRVFYAFNDLDKRSSFKSKKILSKNGILVKKINLKKFENFYQSYNSVHTNNLPQIDAKIALSKDFFTINKRSKSITNASSQKRTHLLRSEYECIISTSKTINDDNAQLNCRVKGLDFSKPDLVIIDLNLHLKKNLKILNNKNKRKIILITSVSKSKKLSFFKKKGLRIINIKKLQTKEDFIFLLKRIKKLNYNRIFLECGLIFLKSCIKNKIISNLYIFKTNFDLKKKGFNSTSVDFIKKLSINNRINVNLDKDNLYKINLKNV